MLNSLNSSQCENFKIYTSYLLIRLCNKENKNENNSSDIKLNVTITNINEVCPQCDKKINSPSDFSKNLS